jgi:hypothetical protein
MALLVMAGLFMAVLFVFDLQMIHSYSSTKAAKLLHLLRGSNQRGT